MLIAISQFNGSSKVFECLKKDKDRYCRFQCNSRDHYYDGIITADDFFRIEKEHQSSFRLEIIT